MDNQSGFGAVWRLVFGQPSKMAAIGVTTAPQGRPFTGPGAFQVGMYEFPHAPIKWQRQDRFNGAPDIARQGLDGAPDIYGLHFPWSPTPEAPGIHAGLRAPRSAEGMVGPMFNPADLMGLDG